MKPTITVPGAAKQAGMMRLMTGLGPAWARRVRPAAMLVATLLGTGFVGEVKAGEAGSAAVPPWSASGHASARLLAAGPDLAGVEIRLDPGFITYWRNPGEAGLPPTFDTAGSVNVAAVTVDFPAPTRLEEGGTTANGYSGAVIFPMHVTPADPAHPAVLAVDLGYAICGTLCLPAAAHLRAALPSAPVPEVAARLAPALAAVPRSAARGAPGALAITGATWVASTQNPAFEVAARARPDATLFVEGPSGWFLEAGRGTPGGQDRVTFRVAVLQKPDGAAPGDLALEATLVDGSGAIEVPLRVDAGPATP